jgi:predicted secreted hydrolase
MADRYALALLLMVCVVAACGKSRDANVESALPMAGRLQVQSVLGGVDDARFARADRVREFDFPADHGPHPDFRSEWWYATITLADTQGERYGVQFTLFRQALTPTPGDAPWRSGQIYMAHAALTDVAAGDHRAWQRFARGRAELAGVTARPFAAWLEDWRLASEGVEVLPLRLHIVEDDTAIDLVLRADKPLVLQGDAGLSRKGENDASYYYSFPRLAAEGKLLRGADEIVVRGLAWIDREWSTSVLTADHAGWDWFALHLDDRTDVMAFQLRRRDGARDPFDAGAWIAADASTEALGVRDFALTPVRWWRDGHGTAWPVAWRLDGARWSSPWTIEAVLDDQRMDLTVEYWEGLVDVKDAAGDGIGEGYMELTGYSRHREETER